jgi:hypothetical protein
VDGEKGGNGERADDRWQQTVYEVGVKSPVSILCCSTGPTGTAGLVRWRDGLVQYQFIYILWLTAQRDAVLVSQGRSTQEQNISITSCFGRVPPARQHLHPRRHHSAEALVHDTARSTIDQSWAHTLVTPSAIITPKSPPKRPCVSSVVNLCRSRSMEPTALTHKASGVKSSTL